MQTPHQVAFIAESLQPTASSMISVERTYSDPRNPPSDTRSAVPATGYSDTRHPITETRSSRPSRAKRHLAWEQIDRDSGGIYAAYLCELATRFPTLSRMELIVAALVKGMLPSHEISKRLSIELKTVENHRNHIRRKLGLSKGNLVHYLSGN